MKDVLLDLIAHVSAIGDKGPTIKVAGTKSQTEFYYNHDKKNGFVSGTVHQPIADFVGVFGITNLSLWKGALSLKAFENDTTVSVIKNNQNAPISVKASNNSGHSTSTLRLMSKAVVQEKVKFITFNGATWHYECLAIDDASVETLGEFMNAFRETTKENDGRFLMGFSAENGQLIAYIGDQTTHSAEFRLFNGTGETTTKKWIYPANIIFSILKTSGTKTLRLSDQGVMEITVTSKFANYRYLTPAHTK
jgi:hypothetical protein